MLDTESDRRLKTRLETDDESLLESIEEEPRTVLITGACGNIGRKLRSGLGRRLRPGPDRSLADPRTIPTSSRPTWTSSTMIGSRTSTASTRSFIWRPTPTSLPRWEDLIGPNLDALANVFHAAALAGVERVDLRQLEPCHGRIPDRVATGRSPSTCPRCRTGLTPSPSWSASDWAGAWPGRST